MDEYALKFFGAFLAECGEVKDQPEAIEEGVERLSEACAFQLNFIQ